MAVQYIVVIAIIVVGIYIAFKPAVNKGKSLYNDSESKKEFNQLLDTYANEEYVNYQNGDTEILTRFDELYNVANDYNMSIYENEQKELICDVPHKNEYTFDFSEFVNLTTFGLITIKATKQKKKKVKEKTFIMPISVKATSSSLKNGFIIMPQTSLPIGGANTKSVLYGLPKKIKAIRIGDTVTIKNLWDNLQYEVSNIVSLQKNDIYAYKVEEGKDRIMLLFGQPDSSNRLAFCCNRINTDDDDTDNE